MKRHAPGCRCCGQAWYAEIGNYTSTARRRHQHFVRRVIPLTLSAQPFLQPFYSGFTNEPTIYADIEGIGVNPSRVGFTTAGKVLLRDDSGTIWKAQEFGRQVEVLWENTTPIATRLGTVSQSGHVIYCEAWGFGFCSQTDDLSGNGFVFNHLGNIVLEARYTLLNTNPIQPKCMDEDGNLYSIYANDGVNPTGVYQNSTYFAPSPPVNSALSHNGTALVAIGLRRVYRWSGTSWVRVVEDLADLWELPPITAASDGGFTNAAYPNTVSIANYYAPEFQRMYYTNGFSNVPLMSLSATRQTLRKLFEFNPANGFAVEYN